MPKTTLMETETLEAALAIDRQQFNNLQTIQELVKRLQKKPPPYIATVARGSSDHAATFAKYAFETKLSIMTASVAPSVHTYYKAELNYKESLVVAISQSGQSNDLLECVDIAKKKGAVTLALVNDERSPLATLSEYVVPLLAGKEHSVAATKSYMATLSRIVQLIAHWKKDQILLDCLKTLPSKLNQKTSKQSLTKPIALLTKAKNILVIGRGLTYPIAQESALKFKETSGLQAESFSSAEVLHGPFELMQKNYPIVVFFQKDNTLTSLYKVCEKILDKKAKIIAIAPTDILHSKPFCQLGIKNTLSTGNAMHPLCDPISLIHTFYPFAAKIALARGKDPDKPANLQKVTCTK